jgi:hypothetical protein
LIFEDRPVLNTVFFGTGYFRLHFFKDFVVAEWTTKKSHHVRIGPKTPAERKVTRFPGAKIEPAGVKDSHRNETIQ